MYSGLPTGCIQDYLQHTGCIQDYLLGVFRTTYRVCIQDYLQGVFRTTYRVNSGLATGCIQDYPQGVFRTTYRVYSGLPTGCIQDYLQGVFRTTDKVYSGLPTGCIQDYLGCPRNEKKKISVRTETNRNKICFAFVSVCFMKPKKKIFGLFRCFEPISKQPKQTELFRNEPKQSGMF